ncbi:MAG TPA: PGPGW domain-containing protein [bacterium]|jgi:tellurite resistance protein TerC
MRKVVIGILGMTVLLIGIALLVLPGPAIVVIPAGLAILATEFLWARKLLKKMKDEAARVGSKLTGRSQPPAVKKEDDESNR